jgi:putative membrane protein
MMDAATMPLWLPYCGPGATPADLAARWNLDPILLATFVLLGLLIWRRGLDRRAGLRIAALALAIVIFVSPLCALSSALFSARTVHHVLLVAAAAPLLAWSLPLKPPPSLTAATLISIAVFWGWHAPGAYAFALSHDAAYWLMQLSLAASALWFWMAVRSASTLAAVGALLVATIQMGLLGALLTLADAAVYAPHLATTAAWGMTPLEDQQAAGLIMWAPAAAIYLVTALVMLGRRIGPPPVQGQRA